ncbi:MAG: hypothetical protein JO102_05355 [Elusimicrobia bacterium]|nr:hypothetical protein [Elusimicrobiota bacterium]
MNTELTSWPTLSDLVVPGAVERGLYFLDDAPGVASRIQDRLVDLLWWDSLAMPAALPSRWATSLEQRGAPVRQRHHRRHSRIGALHWIDTGHRFNPSSLAAQARLRGLDSGRVTRAVHLQSPAGPLAYLESLEKIPNAALCALGEHDRPASPTAFSRAGMSADPVRPPSSIWWTPLLVVTDPLGPVTNGGIPAGDRARLALQVLERFAHLRERAVVIAVLTTATMADRWLAAELIRLGVRLKPEAVTDREAPLAASAAALAAAGSATVAH